MDEAQAWVARLMSLGTAIRRHLWRVVAGGASGLEMPVTFEGGDTIFAIDREVEPVLVREIEAWPDDVKPLVAIVEGLGPDGRRVFGVFDAAPRYRLIVDPIDGSRGLMYDKRSAWFIAAIAPDRGEATSLSDTFAAVLVELPTTKQSWCDSYVACAGTPTIGRRSRIVGEESYPINVRPSSARGLEFGFAHVSSFFPGVKVLAAELMERIVAKTLGNSELGEALVFDDQYISSGGQMVELICGHDRFCCDLRPLFYDIIRRHSGETVCGLECHPYDVAGSLVAKQAGVIVTDGFGNPLNGPLDVSTGIHWCGYANRTIADAVQPVITAWLNEYEVGLGS